MPTKPTTTLSSVGSQRDHRYLDTVYDQHKSTRFPDGRPWWGYREHASNKGDQDGFVGGDLGRGDHTDPFASAWHAPWAPDVRFFEFTYRTHRARIRYDRIIGEDTAALRRYYDAAAKIAHANSWPEVAVGGQPRHGITAIIGDPPRSPRVAEAAQAGDPWLLGITDEVNEALAALLGLSRQGFAIQSSTTATTALASPDVVLGADPGRLQQMIDEAVATALAARDLSEMAKATARRAKQMSAKPAA